MEDKELFEQILHLTCEKRFDVNKIMKHLQENTDFFIAPASSKFHLNIKDGLLKHSLNVYDVLLELAEKYYPACDPSTIAIAALFHDLCKADFYKIEMRNVKVGASWTTQPTYVVDDKFPVGHGEKSVIQLLQLGIKLTEEEILAIRWHMSGFDNAVKGGECAMQNASNKYKLVTLLQCADMISSSILEREEN